MARGEADDPLDVTQSIEQERVPRGWALTSLGAVIPRPRSKVAPDESSALPFLGMDHVEADGFKLLGQDQFRNMKSAGSAFFSGDVLYGRLRPYLNKVHRATFDGVASAEFIVLPPSAAIDTEFLKYLIHQKAFVNFASEHSSGDRPRVNFDAISKFQFALPPLAEQRRIVSRIDELFSRIEAGERAIEEARTGLKRYRKAVLKAAVTGALTEDWRAANPPKETGADLLTRILEARRNAWLNTEIKKLKAKGKPAPTTAADIDKRLAQYEVADTTLPDDLPPSPTGWTWAKFGTVFDVFTGSTPSRKRPDFWNGRIPWVSSGEVEFSRIKSTREYITETGMMGSSVKLHPPGTILLAMIGEGKTRGQCAILDIPATNNQNAAAIRVSQTPILPEYVMFFLEQRYEASRKEGQGGNQPALNASKVSSIVLPLPPVAEQAEIVSRVDEALSRADAAEATLDAQSRAARALKQSILKAAFAGRLVPQDPADEPASELLKRVKEAAA